MYPSPPPTPATYSSDTDIQIVLEFLDQLIATLDPQDAESLEAIQLAQALAATISPDTVLQNMKRAQARVEMDAAVRWLAFKPGGKERARVRGCASAVETGAEDDCLALETTKELLRLALGHVSRSTEGGCRLVADILFLHVAALLTPKGRSEPGPHSVYVVPDVPLDTVQLDAPANNVNPNPNPKFGGLADYVLAKYPLPAGVALPSPGDWLKPEWYRTRGSVNIFVARTRVRLEDGVLQCVLAAASWCKFAGEEVMRGGVTTGDDWVFFAYRRGGQNPSRSARACYARTEVFHVGEDLENLDWILGVLIDWVENAKSFEHFEHFDVGDVPSEVEMQG
ncbi:hypothetical protein GSI_07424 [Ganoderma sinense ZZ0214-1]|uniref:Uncharacterized protein n=1 Tax=Ganoderma sinense ZZ0214-1 TaxID=1077348 RepID=A0A2G8S8Z7_9APHY|nr:hypothetical protein GSI_07424 [Ganoderma sinense ZZ0214-1]